MYPEMNNNNVQFDGHNYLIRADDSVVQTVDII